MGICGVWMGMRAFKRSAVVAGAAVAAVALTWAVSPAARASEDFVPGSGRVDTRLVKIGPTAGQLAFAPTVGLAVANYANRVGRGETQYIDFAGLDPGIPQGVKDNSPSVRVDSTDDNAEKGASRTTFGFPDGSPVRAGGTFQQARAGKAPFGESSFTLGDFAPVPGAVELAGGKVLSHAGIVGGTTREAWGTVDIRRLALGGGAVVLRDLRWEVHQRTGAAREAGGSFTVGAVTLGGTDVGVRSPEQLAALQQQLDDALKPLALAVELPAVSVTKGVATISPLRVRIAGNAVSEGIGGPAVGALQPVREPITQGLIDGNHDAGNLITLGDVSLGALTGKGHLDVEIGGGTATTEGTLYADPFSSFLAGGGAGPVTLGGDGGASSVVDGGRAGTGAVRAPDRPAAIALARSRTTKGSTGGPAAVVGLLGLVAVLAMGGADWHRLRHEPRPVGP
jgi:hypothetical protein